jgi:hypothetical protein
VRERLDLAGLDLPVALLRQSKKTPSLTASGSEQRLEQKARTLDSGLWTLDFSLPCLPPQTGQEEKLLSQEKIDSYA